MLKGLLKVFLVCVAVILVVAYIYVVFTLGQMIYDTGGLKWLIVFVLVFVVAGGSGKHE